MSQEFQTLEALENQIRHLRGNVHEIFNILTGDEKTNFAQRVSEQLTNSQNTIETLKELSERSELVKCWKMLDTDQGIDLSDTTVKESKKRIKNISRNIDIGSKIAPQGLPVLSIPPFGIKETKE
jgi:hypothetical protein